jgi:hypothetical protein
MLPLPLLRPLDLVASAIPMNGTPGAISGANLLA